MPFKVIKKIASFAFADGGSITARVMRSGIWVGISTIGLQLLNIARSVVLARLLTPEMFGLMGIAMIAVRAIETFTRPGVAQALIARQQAFDEASPTAFTLLIVRGILLALVLVAAAPWVASFYEADRLEAILQVLSVVFVIGSFSNINMIARQRELDFRRLTYLSQVTNLLGTAVTVSVAYWTRDVWALVVGQIAMVTLNTLLSYCFIDGRVKFAFKGEVARDLLSYGKFITGSSIALYIASEADSAVVGKVLGTEQLGFYTMAFTIAHLATTNLSKIASGIMMPAYSKLQSDIPALREAYLRTLSLVVLAVLPASAGVIILAEPLIHVVYGEKWLPAAVPLQVLAIFGLFRALAAFSGYLFEGIGLPKIALKLGLVRLAIVGPLIVPLTSSFGLMGAAVTVTLGMAAQWLVGLVYLRQKVGIGVPQFIAVLRRPVWTTAVMALLVYLIWFSWNDRSLYGLSVMVVCGVAVYALLNYRAMMEVVFRGRRSMV